MGKRALFETDGAAPRVVIIGGGKMGEAILSGWLAQNEGVLSALSPESFVVVDPGEERRAYLEDTYQVSCLADAREVSAEADVVVLAVKPQVMMDMLATIQDKPEFANALFVSIAAGLTTERLEEALPGGAHLVRVMPNTPLMVGKGASGVCGGSCADADEVALVRDLFGALGVARVVDEADMDAVCAVSGSGPAYVAAMVEALRDAGAQLGLDAQVAEDLALQTVFGTASLMLETGQSPETCRVAVCSPGGTTLAALDAMYAAGFNHVFEAGVSAAARRSKELSAC